MLTESWKKGTFSARSCSCHDERQQIGVNRLGFGDRHSDFLKRIFQPQ